LVGKNIKQPKKVILRGKANKGGAKKGARKNPMINLLVGGQERKGWICGRNLSQQFGLKYVLTDQRMERGEGGN